jgi:hypothetical protein
MEPGCNLDLCRAERNRILTQYHDGVQRRRSLESLLELKGHLHVHMLSVDSATRTYCKVAVA